MGKAAEGQDEEGYKREEYQPGDMEIQVGKERQELSLEQAFEQIEDVIANLEAEEITLEESFREYNRGMKLLQYCNETIDRVEKRVMQINEEGGLDEF